MCGVNDTRFDERGGVEDLAGHISCRRNDNESDLPVSRFRNYSIEGTILVEDRHAAQVAAVPFRLVFPELGVDRLEERAHERYFEGGSNERSLGPDVFT